MDALHGRGGTEEHCQEGAGFIAGERIYNWLAETLAGAG
jgi:hypothetical protein